MSAKCQYAINKFLISLQAQLLPLKSPLEKGWWLTVKTINLSHKISKINPPQNREIIGILLTTAKTAIVHM